MPLHDLKRMGKTTFGERLISVKATSLEANRGLNKGAGVSDACPVRDGIGGARFDQGAIGRCASLWCLCAEASKQEAKVVRVR
jgi:hypothetical protein